MDAHRRVIEETTATLDGVDRALVRLSDGTYRVCEACGDAIGDDALLADPTLRRCTAHVAPT